jgi:UDP-N-acetylglucosamine acyltransferase
MADQANIHPLAFVEEGASIGKGVVIEPFAVVKKNVVLEEGVVIKSHAYIDGNTTIGAHTVIYPNASIGTKAQDLKFRGERTFVTIGRACEIREFVTINSSCQENSTVKVGNNCLLMAYCHVAHNCEVGNNVIMANNATLAGHVIIEDNAIIGGMSCLHQYVRMGAYSMVGGMCRITHDIPPYFIGGDVPFKFGGLNIIGLKRKGFSLETRCELSKAFKLLYRSGLSFAEALDRIEAQLPPSAELRHLLAFCRASKRGLMVQHGAKSEPDAEEEVEEVGAALPKDAP